MTHLECSLCSLKFEAGRIWNLCECGGPLLVRYDLARLRLTWQRESLASAPNSMWRYAPALPVRNQDSIISLGEGMTPLLPAHRTGARIGANDLLIKDEGLNPTGSFKARGMSCAVSMCVEFGVKVLAIPSAGNAASALSAYAAAAGLEAHIFMPADVPQANFIECKAYGAHGNTGRWPYQRLRTHCRGTLQSDCRYTERLVRYQYVERTLSDRRQEDDGL